MPNEPWHKGSKAPEDFIQLVLNFMGENEAEL